MQVKPEQFAEHLKRKGLQRCYLVHGPEPLQATETADAVRAAARTADVHERLVFDGANQDWDTLRAHAGNLSLFADRRLIEVRLGAKKPDQAGAECLRDLATDTQSPDTLLITAEQLERQQLSSAWFKACDQAGVVIPCREPELGAFRSWLAARARAHGLELSDEARDFLALRAEGNLLAAAQELEKLRLTVTDRKLDVAAVMAAITDSARYDVFQCIDAALTGDPARTVKIVRGLQEEGTEPVVISWSVTRELRTLTRVAAEVACGKTVDAALTEQNVWSSRQALIKRALQRHPVARLSALLEASFALDQLIKGNGIGNVWDEFETLLLAVAGGPWLGTVRHS